MTFQDTFIYRLLTPAGWEAAKASGHLPYAPVDEKDGFFHLSTAEQVLETARRHYAEHQTLVAVGMDPEALGDDLKWEPSRGGVLFPHYYGFVPTSVVAHLVELKADGAGVFVIVGEQKLDAS